MVSKERTEFEVLIRPVMKFLADHYHPHVKVIVSSTYAEMVEGIRGIQTFEFVDGNANN